jgi:heme O synthase-like polyprenyltransferase
MLEYSLWFSISTILLYYLNTRLAFLVVGAIFAFYWCFLATEIYRYSQGPPGLRIERNLFECCHVPNEDFWIQERAWLRTYFELGPVLAMLFAAVVVLSSP